MTKLYLNTRDELLRFDVSKIVYFEGDGNYTHIFTVNRLKSTVGINLGLMEKNLSEQLGSRAEGFCRVGKRFIINLNYVFQVHPNRQQLTLSDCSGFAFQLNVSKEALKNLKTMMLSIKQ